MNSTAPEEQYMCAADLARHGLTAPSICLVHLLQLWLLLLLLLLLLSSENLQQQVKLLGGDTCSQQLCYLSCKVDQPSCSACHAYFPIQRLSLSCKVDSCYLGACTPAQCLIQCITQAALGCIAKLMNASTRLAVLLHLVSSMKRSS